MRLWKRMMMCKNAMRAFVLLFALQAIAAPGVCAIHDQKPTPARISDAVLPAGPIHVVEPALTPQLDGLVSDQAGHEDNESNQCNETDLLAADTRLPAPALSVIVFNMAPAWRVATLQPLLSGSALPPRWARLTWPPPQSSPLKTVPRLRI